MRQSGVKAVLGGDVEARPEQGEDAGVTIAAAAAAAAPAAAPEWKPEVSARPAGGLDPETREALRAVLAELTALRDMLPRNNG